MEVLQIFIYRRLIERVLLLPDLVTRNPSDHVAMFIVYIYFCIINKVM